MATTDIRQWLQQATKQLAGVSDTPELDARYGVCAVLDVGNSYLFSHSEQLLTAIELEKLDQLLQRRLQGEPLAYILGHWSFWNIELEVNPSTLIPRPDTELLVEQVFSLPLPVNARVLDLGTGTGAIALALAYNRPQWQVIAADTVPEAVALAQRNVQRLAVTNCQVIQSNWFSAFNLAEPFDLIVSNPPYIEPDDPHLTTLRYEPLSALVAAEQGLADIQLICHQAPAYLKTGGWLWLEHGYNQDAAVQAILNSAGFINVRSERDYGGNWRITGGCISV